jgi:hypothetical protein
MAPAVQSIHEHVYFGMDRSTAALPVPGDFVFSACDAIDEPTSTSAAFGRPRWLNRHDPIAISLGTVQQVAMPNDRARLETH